MNSDKEGDDLFSAVCGDLGLGTEQRSSSFLNYELSMLKSPLVQLHSPKPAEDITCRDKKIKGVKFVDIVSSIAGKSNKSKQSVDEVPEDEDEVFPTYADVPYGTSLRQQKKLYEREMGTLRKQHADSIDEDNEQTENGKYSLYSLSGHEIDEKLSAALQEMDELKLELETCQKRLDAKYKAVTILKQQAELADSELRSSEKKFNENSRRLEQEVNKLQFELEWKESSFLDSQQTWAERFDRVCQENVLLMSKLEARTEELRRISSYKTALSRERDELLALLDVTERQKYEQNRSKIGEEEYGTFSSSELAVLGACKCRGHNPEPCGCAHAAANLKKDNAKLREEAESNVKRREEAFLTVDAYRTAFEEQLSKNRLLTMKLADISTQSSRSVRAKAAIKWLVHALSEDEDSSPKADSKRDDYNNLPSLSLHELVSLLTDLIHKKNEALAHKKLAAQVLANKLRQLESECVEADTQPSTDSNSTHLSRTTNEKPNLNKRSSIKNGISNSSELENNS